MKQDCYVNDKELRKNSSGCNDPTAYKAIKNVDREENFNKLLRTIFSICELSGFRIEGRIVLVDEATGKVWR